MRWLPTPNMRQVKTKSSLEPQSHLRSSCLETSLLIERLTDQATHNMRYGRLTESLTKLLLLSAGSAQSLRESGRNRARQPAGQVPSRQVRDTQPHHDP